MRNPRYRVYFLLVLILLCLLSLGSKPAQGIRSYVIASVAPLWEYFISTPHKHEETDFLKVENRRLLGEISYLKDMVRREIALLEELKQNIPSPLNEVMQTTKKRYWHYFNTLMLLKAIPAKVIYRSPAFWDQCCWINVGTEMNAIIGADVVAKNSPVVIGDNIVGVVEEVQSRQSRVRWITDSSLVPSVRVKRTLVNGEEILLAKGEIHGMGQPLWRGHRQVLKGIGFNYDFDDEEGPARDLRNSEPPLIQVGDLLVTTGMDGVFPPNFPIAEVTLVQPLHEGDYTYEIEAIPVAGNFDEIRQVFVLPKLF